MCEYLEIDWWQHSGNHVEQGGVFIEENKRRQENLCISRANAIKCRDDSQNT